MKDGASGARKTLSCKTQWSVGLEDKDQITYGMMLLGLRGLGICEGVGG